MNETFICEICHCETPVDFEGGEPNTCADCVPIDFELIRQFKAQNKVGLNNLSTEREKAVEMAKKGQNGDVYGS